MLVNALGVGVFSKYVPKGATLGGYLFEKSLNARAFSSLVKHSEKFCSVFGGHLICINFLYRKWEGYYA